MKSSHMTSVEDRAVPFVTEHATRWEWLGVFALWFVLNFGGMPLYVRELPQVHWWQLSVILTEDALLWVGLTYVYFHIFDRTPLMRGGWHRNGVLRAITVVAIALLQAQVIWIIGNATAGRIGMPAEVLEPPYFNRSELNADAFLYSIIAMAVHGWLRKVIQNRLASERAAALEGQLSTARLQALSTELQPHFLFNTLNGIAALIPTEPDQAEAMLLNLSDLLRHTLNHGSAEGVPLYQELERLDVYLDIQRMRLGDRLQTERSIDPSVLRARVPSMILQPLVENAVRHGIEPRPGKGSIAIRATRSNGRLVIEVEDDGAGLPAVGEVTEGIGLSNTRSRIETMFSGGSLTLRAQPAGGAVARLEMPYEHVAALNEAPDSGSQA